MIANSSYFVLKRNTPKQMSYNNKNPPELEPKDRMESYFDQIAQELRKQKQRMDQLEAENRKLRQELANLRRGVGIVVEIAGIRFPLRDGLVPV